MSADPELVEFVRKHLEAYGEDAIRQQLLSDGVAAPEIEEALREARIDDVSAPIKGRLALYAAVGGAILLSVALAMSGRKSKETPGPDKGNIELSTTPDNVFHGHYGYMIKLPPGYEAVGGFEDAEKTREVVHMFPKGTDHAHFIDEGLYGQLGILRLEVSPRRVPQGQINLETLESWTKTRLASDKANYKGGAPQLRPQTVHEMPGFIVNVSEPFAFAKAYILGQKVYYILTGGSEDTVFTGILSGLIEVVPIDEPGK